MKALLLSALLLGATTSVFAQGQVIFANNGPTTITNLMTGLPAAGGAAQDDTQVALYVGNVGDSVNSLTMIGSVTNCFSAGRFSGGTRTLAGWTSTVQLQVRAWLASTVYPSYEAAFSGALGGDSSVLIGVSAPFSFVLTQPPTAPSSIAGNGLTPIVFGIPEPSSVALGVLGVLALTLFRSRR